MERLSFVKIMPEDFDSLGGIWNSSADAEKLREELCEFKRVMIALKSGEEYIAAASLVFEMNDADFTEPMEKIHLSHMAVKESLHDRGYDVIVVEYIADLAENMGYRYLTAKGYHDDRSAIKLFSSHGFESAVGQGEDEKGKYFKMVRDLSVKVKCCGCGNV